MSALFKKKQLTPAKRICLRLKEQRLEKGVNLTALAKKTKISKKHLIALEKCHFNELPEGDIYQKNFIKNYLEALDINPQPFLDQFIQEEISFTKHKTAKHPLRHLGSAYFSNLPHFLRVGTVVLIIALFALYLGSQVKNILEPPRLAIASPENGFVSNEPQIVVAGETEKEVRVSINGREIKNNENGQFSETIDLSPGLNTIAITAKKKHGKTTEETRHVILRE